MSGVVHFELPSSDLPASRKFYENVFRWQIKQWPGPTEYWLITTGEPGSMEIGGAIGGAANDFKGTVNTVGVANLDETIQQVLANGGQVIMPRSEIPEVGWLAYVREPGGAVLGVLEPFPGSSM